jgi:Protein of unknown function (DUF1236)
MRNRLLVTTAMAALIGCTTLAVAQEPSKEAPGKTTVAPQGGGAQHPIGAPSGAAPGGAMAHPQPNGEVKPGGAVQNLPQQAPKTAPQQQSQGQEHPGQGAPENHGVSQSEERNNPTTQRGAERNEPNKATGTQQPAAGQSQQNAQGAAAPNKASGGASVQLSQDQRTKIQGVIGRDHDAPRVSNVNFNISVGVTVPRTVHVAVLPADVVTIVPEYRGFDYIIVGDQLLIIDPNTMEIVAILPA